jgi:hypothetical protein
MDLPEDFRRKTFTAVRTPPNPPEFILSETKDRGRGLADFLSDY